MKQLLFSLLSLFSLNSLAQANYLDNKTLTFEEAIRAFQTLADAYPKAATLQYIGGSDYGKEMPLFLINADGKFSKQEIQKKNVLFINNAIHPGEPCGVDASLKLATELLDGTQLLPENLIIAIIPIYNIGGAHNRNCCSRTNQDGPEEYGFRGNALNLDLNRDFVKADSKNTHAFYKIFHFLQPSVFVDTHTSNGADYQHTMTLITSQQNKMTPAIRSFTQSEMNPFLYKEMAAEGFPMVPYVHGMKETPADGIMDYLETPRYSTGYTNLFNTISYVSEAHMLKPYPQRVEATYILLQKIIAFMGKNGTALKELKIKANQEVLNAKTLPLNWDIDTTQFDTIQFMGYEGVHIKSEVTGLRRLFYDHQKPYTQYIKYYTHYSPTNFVTVPDYYIIPQQWNKVVELLKQNHIVINQFEKDTLIPVQTSNILDFETVKFPYEGHYLHYDIKTIEKEQLIAYRKGDYAIPTNNKNKRFIVELLEPAAPDSYFAWNYFDAILQQKEWFSPYVFEDEAVNILKNNPDIRTKFENKRMADSSFAANSFAQLYFIYKLTDHYETSLNEFPISRVFIK